MAVPILRLNIDDNPRIIVKQDTTPITYTGWTVNLVGSGGTIVTGSGANWTIYSSVPSGNTWGSLSGSISNQTDLWNILTGQTADILANAQCCTGNTAAIDYHYSQFTAFTDYFATLIIPAITGNTQDISDLSGAFDSHTGNTLIHFEKTDISYNDLQDLPTLFSGDYDDLTNKPDLSIYLTGYTVTADDVTGITTSLYAPIIHTHPYSGLTGLPTLFSGDYNDLTNKPDLSVYQPVSGMSAYLTGVTWNDVTNKPDLTLQSDFTGHTSDLTIHYPQSGISITESQISDLQAYTLTGTTQALSDAFNTYTGTTAPASFLPITGLTGYWNSGETVAYVTGVTPTVSLSGCSDVTITSPADYDILRYSGTTWVNEAATDIFTNVDDGELLARNGTAISGITQGTFALSGHNHTGVYVPFTTTIVTLTASTILNSTYAGKIVEVNSTGATTITLSSGMTTGMQLNIVNVNTGDVTIAAQGTLQGVGTILATQYTKAEAYHRGSNVWLITGTLTS